MTLNEVVPSELHLVVPGPLAQKTGGYLYDARMVRGLTSMGWRVVVHNVEGRFPDPDDIARADMERTIRRVPDGAWVLVDGLAMGGLPHVFRDHHHRVRLLALVHHRLCDETGLEPDVRDRLERSETEALSYCCGVLVTSPFTKRRVAELGVDLERVRVAPPGTEVGRGPRQVEGKGPPTLLCVGSVIPRKGQRVLIDALAGLLDLDWRCVFVGSLERAPEYAASTLQAAQRMGLMDRIRFLGETDAAGLETQYQAASIFVLPSFHEGYGMALAEALAYGLPIVSTTAGAIPDTVPDGVGLLGPPGDDVELARALRTLVTDESTRRKMAARSRRYGEALPNWEQAVEGFAQSIVELARNPPSVEPSSRQGTQ